jgi:protein-L-isoaspartate(D-aspartate) O-methyltransferase
MAWRSSGGSHRELIENLFKNGLIKDQRIKQAMLSVDRADFTDQKSDAYDDRPQSIGYAVTISAPHMHCFGLEILKDQLKPGAKVLDVGSGSGYLTACMAHLVRPGGKAIGVEHIQELVDKSIVNIKKNNKDLFDQGILEIHKGDGRQGYAAEAPYDAIHVGAAAPDTPHELIRQLKVGGRLVSPVGGSYGQEMITYDKKADGSYHEQTHMGVIYVPLTDEQKQYDRAGMRRKDL